MGIELSKEFCITAKRRVEYDENIKIIHGDSFHELEKLDENMFDLCITSPPYWDILNMKRSVDGKKNINYSQKRNDMGNIAEYKTFINELGNLFLKVRRVMKSGAYCLVNIMDVRKKNKFYPLHIDLAVELQRQGYIFDDIIIWDRQQDYNNMRPLGYPYKYRINKIHEYILIFIRE